MLCSKISLLLECIILLFTLGEDDDWVTAPQILGSNEVHKAVGDNLCLECSVNSTDGAEIDLYWSLPNNQRATKVRSLNNASPPCDLEKAPSQNLSISVMLK